MMNNELIGTFLVESGVMDVLFRKFMEDDLPDTVVTYFRERMPQIIDMWEVLKMHVNEELVADRMVDLREDLRRSYMRGGLDTGALAILNANPTTAAMVRGWEEERANMTSAA